MNIITKNIRQIFTTFLFIQPIVDLMTSLGIRFFHVDISVGMIIRFLFLAVGLIYILFISKSKFKKWSLIYLGLVFLYFIIYLFNSYNFHDSLAVCGEIKSLLKIYYFPIILTFFWNAYDDEVLNLKSNMIVKIAFIYFIIIFLSQLTGTQFISYTNGKLGHVGWFYSSNEIGAILAILSPLVIYSAIKNRKSIYHNLLLASYIFTLLIIGTKAPFLGITISLICFITIYIIKVFTEDKNFYKVLLSPLIISMIFIILILPDTPAGYNLNLHLKWLNIGKINEIYKPKHKTELTNFIFSSRDVYLNKIKTEYMKLPIEQKLLGLGYYGNGGKTDKLIEMDYYDIFYRNGIIGFILYFTLLIFIIGYIIKDIIKSKIIIKTIMDSEIVSYIVGILLSLSIAYFAGHVFLAPAVSIYIVILISLINNRIKQIKQKSKV